MKIQSFLPTPSYHRFLWLVPAIGSIMAFAEPSSVAATAARHPTVHVLTEAVGKHPARDQVTIGARTYNPETMNFDQPWPFGPESNS